MAELGNFLLYHWRIINPSFEVHPLSLGLVGHLGDKVHIFHNFPACKQIFNLQNKLGTFWILLLRTLPWFILFFLNLQNGTYGQAILNRLRDNNTTLQFKVPFIQVKGIYFFTSSMRPYTI